MEAKAKTPTTLKYFKFLNLLGQGNFSEVWRVQNVKTKDFYAMKIINNDQIQKQPKVLDLLESEIHILKSLNNENVVKLYDNFFEDNRHYLLMEFCNGVDFERYVKSKPKKTISEDEAIIFLKQMTNGFKALQKQKAMHRDFKLANVLIHEGVFKIGDLGFSKQAETAKTALGTALYMAPEVMKFQRYNNKIDLWSLGICLYEMLMGTVPFKGSNEKELLTKMMLNRIDFNVNGKETVSSEFQDLIKRMLAPNPLKRIDWNDVYNHKILRPNYEERKEPLNIKILYLKNIIYFHAKILDDGHYLMKNNNGIYIYFILSKRMLFLSKGFSEDEKEIYEAYFDYLLAEILKYETFNNPLYDTLKGEFNKDWKDVNNLLFKEILLDYCLGGEFWIKNYLEEKKEEEAKMFVIHLIELVDCFKFKDSLNFNPDEESGFNFEKYNFELSSQSSDDLIKLFNSKINNLF